MAEVLSCTNSRTSSLNEKVVCLFSLFFIFFTKLMLCIWDKILTFKSMAKLPVAYGLIKSVVKWFSVFHFPQKSCFARFILLMQTIDLPQYLHWAALHMCWASVLDSFCLEHRSAPLNTQLSWALIELFFAEGRSVAHCRFVIKLNFVVLEMERSTLLLTKWYSFGMS